MRLFFGLKIAPQVALDIDVWRQRTLPPFPDAVPVENLHITLAFLGKVSDRQLEPLTMFADEIRASGIELTLDELGYWHKPDLLWIGPSEIPTSLTRLADSVKGIRRRMGFRSESRAFVPHVTIVRNCAIPPPASVTRPGFRVSFDSFALFESTRTRQGLRYQVKEEWALSWGTL
jgi:2'-5' RNA ligase